MQTILFVVWAGTLGTSTIKLAKYYPYGYLRIVFFLFGYVFLVVAFYVGISGSLSTDW